jgi:hypothetical protein
LPREQRIAVVVANLLVPGGVLLLGWNAAAAAFLIWLDMALVSLGLGVLVFAALRPTLPTPPGTHRGGWLIGVGIGMLFVAPIFIAPPLLVGMEIHDSLRAQFPQGLLAAAFADRAIYLWIAIELVTRGFQVLARAGQMARQSAAAASFVPQIGEQVMALMFRAVILIHLAWLAAWLGRAGLVAFLFGASAFLMYTELHENWLRRLHGRLLQFEAKLKERAKEPR